VLSVKRIPKPFRARIQVAQRELKASLTTLTIGRKESLSTAVCRRVQRRNVDLLPLLIPTERPRTRNYPPCGSAKRLPSSLYLCVCVCVHSEGSREDTVAGLKGRRSTEENLFVRWYRRFETHLGSADSQNESWRFVSCTSVQV